MAPKNTGLANYAVIILNGRDLGIVFTFDHCRYRFTRRCERYFLSDRYVFYRRLFLWADRAPGDSEYAQKNNKKTCSKSHHYNCTAGEVYPGGTCFINS